MRASLNQPCAGRSIHPDRSPQGLPGRVAQHQPAVSAAGQPDAFLHVFLLARIDGRCCESSSLERRLPPVRALGGGHASRCPAIPDHSSRSRALGCLLSRAGNSAPQRIECLGGPASARSTAAGILNRYRKKRTTQLLAAGAFAHAAAISVTKVAISCCLKRAKSMRRRSRAGSRRMADSGAPGARRRGAPVGCRLAGRPGLEPAPEAAQRRRSIAYRCYSVTVEPLAGVLATGMMPAKVGGEGLRVRVLADLLQMGAGRQRGKCDPTRRA